MFNKKVREEWEIRHDARTLAEAEAIKFDKDRYRQAVNMAGKMLKDDLERVASMKRVASSKVGECKGRSPANNRPAIPKNMDVFYGSISNSRK